MTSSDQKTGQIDRGHGERLRQAREAAGLGVAEVAQRLKMQVRVVESLEAGADESVVMAGGAGELSEVVAGWSFVVTLAGSGVTVCCEATALRPFGPRLEGTVDSNVFLSKPVSYPDWNP